MRFHNQHRRLYQILAPLLALLMVLSPLNSSAASFTMADSDMTVMLSDSDSGQSHCDEMDNSPACAQCDDQAQCKTHQLCGHSTASLIQNELAQYYPHSLSIDYSYSEYLPTAVPEAAFRPPISL